MKGEDSLGNDVSNNIRNIGARMALEENRMVKATYRLTNFMRRMRTTFKIQRNKGNFSLSDFSCMQVCDERYRQRFTRKRQPMLAVLVVIPLNIRHLHAYGT